MLHAALLSLVLAASSATARVVTINDGDTITVKLEGRSEQVRLVGIDAPELHDERKEYRGAAYAAKSYARTRLAGETVTLEPDESQADRDKYGRLLRYVILDDGTNVNEELVLKGHARVYDRLKFTLKSRFRVAEEEAKRAKVGVWALPPGPARQVSDAPR